MHHEHAVNHWAMILEKDSYFCTGNYIIVETLALLQSRLGFDAANLWYGDVLGLADILWVDGSMHNLAHELWRSLGRRKLSFVDCISFVMMRHYKIEKVLGFDKHFAEQGFENVWTSGCQ